LILSPSYDLNLLRATNNVQKLEVREVMDVNVMDLLQNKYVIMTEEGLQTLTKRLA
jgi:ribosomal protein L4